jgi:protein-S-isoprenylcysteine O-methyltransferase Ste14|tara:strand:- start:156 stop:905 length:750 start_codon:yes stop_codon:yes gene_type:complete
MNTFYILSLIWVLIGLGTFVYLFFESAPYGRHIKEGWGIEIPARLGWVIMESPSVILMIIYALIVRDQLQIIHKVFLLIWLTHYIHRTFIYPFLIEMTNPKMPISIALSAFFFNLVNVSIQAFGIFYFTEYSENWISSSTFIIGLSIFLLGMYINIRSDYIIVAMKKRNGPGYHIPQTFLYKYLSAPNYFGEIIEWLGWAILTWSISGVVFLIWVIANLFPRAIAHHRWYKNKFDDYPKNRKAIIPGII